LRFLLDTHVFLWWLADDPKLGPAARQAVADPAAIVHLSAASVWEIAIKAGLGRIDTGDADIPQVIAACGFVELPITSHHAWLAGRLPRHHDDPFDRMLVAQAQHESLRLVTADPAFKSYELSALWV
jgi:PIN domain nuclease of toxin-antitoxin system